MHFIWAHMFLCPCCSEPIVLQRQSLFGTSEGLQYQAKGVWPISFLCFRRSQVCECLAGAIHYQVAQDTALVLGRETFWQIDIECARENCAQPQTIYTKYFAEAPETAIFDRVLLANETIKCPDGHKTALDPSRIQIKQI
jgi:hypothetical protein